MAQKLNVEEYRKERKKKKIVKNIVVFLILSAIILTTVFIWKGLSDSSGNIGNGNNFPLSLAGDPIFKSTSQGSNLTLLTDKELLFFTSKGKKVRTVNHSDMSPTISTSENEVLLYDANGTSFSVESVSSTSMSKSTINNIFLGKIASNGNVAIVTSDSKYACSLTIYDKKGNEIYIWNSAENIITSINFLDGGNGCIVSTTGVTNSLTSTAIYKLSFSKKDEVFKTNIEGYFGLGVDLIGGYFHVVTDDAIVMVDQKGSISKTVPLDQSVKQFLLVNNKYIVVLLGEDAKSNSVVRVYDHNGNKVGEAQYSYRIKRIASDGSYVATLSDKNITTNSMTMKQLGDYGDKQNTLDIICCNQIGFEVGTVFINRFKLS